MTEDNFAPEPKLPEGAFVNSEIRITSYFDSNGHMMFGIMMGGNMNIAQALGLLVLGGIETYKLYKEGESDGNWKNS